MDSFADSFDDPPKTDSGHQDLSVYSSSQIAEVHLVELGINLGGYKNFTVAEIWLMSECDLVNNFLQKEVNHLGRHHYQCLFWPTKCSAILVGQFSDDLSLKVEIEHILEHQENLKKYILNFIRPEENLTFAQLDEIIKSQAQEFFINDTYNQPITASTGILTGVLHSKRFYLKPVVAVEAPISISQVSGPVTTVRSDTQAPGFVMKSDPPSLMNYYRSLPVSSKSAKSSAYPPMPKVDIDLISDTKSFSKPYTEDEVSQVETSFDASKQHVQALALKKLSEINHKKEQNCKEDIRNECEICGHTFTALSSLIHHYRSHAGLKPYRCSNCGSSFTRRHSLNYHMLIHSNVNRFRCRHCGHEFRHPSHYKEHLRKHTGERPYVCCECKNATYFRTRSLLKRHLFIDHGLVLRASGLYSLPNDGSNEPHGRLIRQGYTGLIADAQRTTEPTSSAANETFLFQSTVVGQKRKKTDINSSESVPVVTHDMSHQPSRMLKLLSGVERSVTYDDDDEAGDQAFDSDDDNNVISPQSAIRTSDLYMGAPSDNH